jgi:hypothetical protein
MATFVSGIGASLVAGALLWAATHQRDVVLAFSARRERRRLAGLWHSYHLSRDSTTSRRAIWVRHDHEIRVNALGTLRGSSRANYGERMSYRLSGYVRGAVLRVYLDNIDARESQATFVYPNLLGGAVLLGVLVGEDFDRRWFVSPSVMSRELVTDERLVALARQIRVNRPSFSR